VVGGNSRMLTLAAALALAGCGGGETAAPAGQPAVEPPAPAPAAAQATAEGAPMELSREAFAYRGSGRDPFISLLKSGGVRPLPGDLRVTGINFDARYPQRSVATLRDTTEGRRYTVRSGDVIGRVRILEIKATQVVAVVQEFGVDRPLVLPIRRRQEDTP